MLSLLLCLSALGPLAGAETLTAETEDIDISACPFMYYSEGPYTQFDVSYTENTGDFTTKISFSTTNYITFPPISTAFSLGYEIVTDFSSETAMLLTISADVTRLSSASELCAIKFSGQFGGSSGELWIVSFSGDGVAVYINSAVGSSDFSFVSGFGGTISTPPTSGTLEKAYDLTRCIYEGEAKMVGDEQNPDLNACTVEKCTASSSEYETAFNCDPTQVCMGNDVCGREHVCSIVANTLIDTAAGNGVLPDFCPYTVISGGGLTVTAFLQERRYSDIPFVDSVQIVTTSGGSDYITLSQGGKATLTASGQTTPLTLSSTPTPNNELGVFLEDSGNGPQATFFDADKIFTDIFFQGTLLSVKQRVPVGKSKYSEGVCSDSSDIAGEKSSSASPTCGGVTSDTQADSIVCADREARCLAELESVKEDSVDIDPYVEACEALLCNYYDGDDIYCRFKQAYALVANLPSYGCAEPVCLKKECASQEFCAVAISGAAACFCRSNDADIKTYREGSTYGPAPTCENGVASIQLASCLLVEDGVDPLSLHLIDDTCSGSIQGNLLGFTFDTKDPCGTVYTENGANIDLKNTIQNTRDGQITREDSVAIDVTCSYVKELSSTESFSFQIKDGSITGTFTTAEDYTFDLTISLYSDATMNEEFSDETSFEMNRKVYVKLEATGLAESGLVLVINKCFTTTDDKADGDDVYSLIDNNCPSSADGTVVITTSGTDIYAAYDFNTFEYLDVATPDLYLHAVVSLCVAADGNCEPVCPEE